MSRTHKGTVVTWSILNSLGPLERGVCGSSACMAAASAVACRRSCVRAASRRLLFRVSASAWCSETVKSSVAVIVCFVIPGPKAAP